MKPDILKQKIESLLSQIENMEFLESIRVLLREQLDLEQRESIHRESMKQMNKRRTPGSKKQ
jgi:uncharacterized protein YlbG (UPF0298 family)